MAAEPSAGHPPHPLESAFGRRDAPRPRMHMLRKASLLVTEFISPHEKVLVTGTLPRDDAYVVTLHLRDRPRGDMAAESRRVQPQNSRAGHAGIVDLRMKLESEYAGPFHYLTFYFPRAALDEVTDDEESPRIADLRSRFGVGFSDPVLRHLLLSLRPAMDAGPMETSALYADHVARALVLHLACARGELRPKVPMVRGGLSPWQQRRAKELLDARLDGSVVLAELASSCGLSVRHFTRAFRQSTGRSAHQWLTERRLGKARSLLLEPAHSLSEVATACGFSSQSHFTRVFARATGMSPGAWRRLRRG